MNLEECSKAELIHFIKRFCLFRLDVLEYEVLKYRASEAANMAFKENIAANDALKEYIGLIRSYEGEKIIDIPEGVLSKAISVNHRREGHLKKAEAYNKRFDRIHAEIEQIQKKAEYVHEETCAEESEEPF